MQYIWWLSKCEIEFMGALPKGFPHRLEQLFRAMVGRPLRGRLWGETDREVREDLFNGSLLGVWLASCCGGIVVEERDLSLLRSMPGTVTDFTLQRVALC